MAVCFTDLPSVVLENIAKFLIWLPQLRGLTGSAQYARQVVHCCRILESVPRDFFLLAGCQIPRGSMALQVHSVTADQPLVLQSRMAVWFIECPTIRDDSPFEWYRLLRDY